MSTDMCARRCGADVAYEEVHSTCAAFATRVVVDGVTTGPLPDAEDRCAIAADGRFWPIEGETPRVRAAADLCGPDPSDETMGPMPPSVVCMTRVADRIEVTVDGLVVGCGVPDAICSPGATGLDLETSMCRRRCGAGLDAWRVHATCSATTGGLRLDGSPVGPIPIEDGNPQCFIRERTSVLYLPVN